MGREEGHAPVSPYSQHFPWALGAPAALVVLGLDVALGPVLQRARHIALHHVSTVAPGGKHRRQCQPLPSRQHCLHCQTLPVRCGGRSWKEPPSLGSCWGGASQPCCRSMVPVTALLSPVVVVSPELGCAWHSMDCVVRQAVMTIRIPAAAAVGIASQKQLQQCLAGVVCPAAAPGVLPVQRPT